jgi:hypothetical protein
MGDDFPVWPIDIGDRYGGSGVEEVVHAPKRVGDEEVAACVALLAEDFAVEDIVAAEHAAQPVLVEQVVPVPDERHDIGRAAVICSAPYAVGIVPGWPALSALIGIRGTSGASVTAGLAQTDDPVGSQCSRHDRPCLLD